MENIRGDFISFGAGGQAGAEKDMYHMYFRILLRQGPITMHRLMPL